MATWITHLRIAQAFANHCSPEDTAAYYIGNLAPDCGRLAPDGVHYIPPKQVTHFHDCLGIVQPQLFLPYLQATGDRDFRVGYFLHLLTDLLWREQAALPCIQEHHAEKDQDAAAFFFRLKKEWGQLDQRFLAEYPDFPPLEILQACQAFHSPALPFWEPDGFYSKLSTFLAASIEQPISSDSFQYTQPDTMDRFVEYAIPALRELLQEYGL